MMRTTPPNATRPVELQRGYAVHALDAYANARLVHRRLHESWRKLRRLHGDADPRTKGALTKAASAAIELHNAKRAHTVALLVLRRVEKAARRGRAAA